MAKVSSKITAGEALVRILKAHDVEYIFSSPGSEWPPVWEALAKLRAQEEPTPYYVNCRHEELAVGLASGYAKATGRLPAVLLHAMVGTMHATMAIRAAYHEQIPMVVAAGGSDTFGEDSELDPGAQWLRFLTDLGGPARTVEPYVKWSERVTNLANLPGMVHHACRIALTPPQGPVFLYFPMEVLFQEMAEEAVPKHSYKAASSQPEARLLDQVAQLLVEARSPLIITEQAGRYPENVPLLVALAESLAIPVVESQSPMYLNFPHDHPLHLGFDARPHIDEADVILLLGVQAPWHPPSRGPAKNATVILADDDPGKDRVAFWNFQTDICLAGSLTATLTELTARVRELKGRVGTTEKVIAERLAGVTAEHQRQRRAWKDEAEALATQTPIDTRWLCQVLGQVLPEDAVVMEETITHRVAINKLVTRNRPGTFFSGHYGGLGAGLGIALGLQLARPEPLTVALIGDGAFNYNPVLPALGYAQEYQTPMLIVVFDNRLYASMKGGLLRYYPEGSAVKTGVFYGGAITPGPDYAAVARAMDGYGETVEEPSDVRPALERAIEQVKSGRLALLDVILDPRDSRTL